MKMIGLEIQCDVCFKRLIVNDSYQKLIEFETVVEYAGSFGWILHEKEIDVFIDGVKFGVKCLCSKCLLDTAKQVIES